MKNGKPIALYLLLALLLFQGISGLAGGAVLILSSNGNLIHMPVSMLKGSVFSSFLIPGIILFLVLGVFPIFTFSMLIARPQWAFAQKLNIYKDRHFAWMCSVFVGLGLIIWIDVEVILTGFGSILQTIYGATGLLILIFTLTPRVMDYYKNK